MFARSCALGSPRSSPETKPAARIKGVSFGVTAPDQLRPAAEALVIEMGGEPAVLPAYRALARLTADRALAAGMLSASDAERLLDVLGDHR
jgi:predicted short-subunit dehydrogenase-like oxidoreductase (DUF2520 family)